MRSGNIKELKNAVEQRTDTLKGTLQKGWLL